MSEPIPVNPDMLRWARETAGLNVDDVVRKMKRKRVTAETVLSWENGEGSPSYPQLERIAYEIYKRPLALFFFPEPPQEETPKQSFVCEHFGIPCLNLEVFMENEKWRF